MKHRKINSMQTLPHRIINKRYILDNNNITNVLKAEPDFTHTLQHKTNEIHALTSIHFDKKLHIDPTITKMLYTVNAALPRSQVNKKQIRKKKPSMLFSKIDLGSLVYLNLKSVNNTHQARINCLKNRMLTHSTNFGVCGDKDAFGVELQKLVNKHKDNGSNRSKRLSKAILNTNTNTNSSNNHLHLHLTSSSRNYTTIQQPSSSSRILSPSSSYSRNHKRKLLFLTQDSTSQSYTKHTQFKSQRDMLSAKRRTPLRKHLSQSIMNSANALASHTTHIENELYRIIDSQNNNVAPILDQFHKKDFEEMYGLKVNKKIEMKEHAKDQVLEAVKIRGQYTVMDKEKADIIKFSDDITKMPDEVALVFAERIVNVYNDKSDKLDNDVNKYNILSEEERGRSLKMREKLDDGLMKIKRMTVYLEKKEMKLKTKLELCATNNN